MSTVMNDPQSNPTKTPTDAPSTPAGEEKSFAETALELAGKSAAEAKSTGAMDKADEQVEGLFLEKYRTANSPAHLASWGEKFPMQAFVTPPLEADPSVEKIMQTCLDVVRTRRDDGRLLDEKGKITEETFAELGAAGYWGLLVDQEYGGSGVRFTQFAKFLTRMATVDPTTAGLASVHGCIGAVDPLLAFGNEEQKREYLPKLASGEKLSAFALTEPCAGSDLTALRTTAVLDGSDYVVNGEKLFITNAVPGRTVGLVCLIEGKPAVLIADLPAIENENFQIKPYGLYALKSAYNQGMVFKDFRVPAKNLLDPGKGDGLIIAYHGLNRGRVALCANAAGTMRVMLQSILPWASYRKTYGQAIEKRELVRHRVAQLAGHIVSCDALTEWCAWLLDEGYRGEMECIIAKIYGSEVNKEAAIELFMKTHGGRSFLHGHLLGDNLHDFLAPCIYEGEGEMLGMAYFKSLVKEHGKKYFEPIGKALHAAGIKEPNMANPTHLWALRGPALNYVKWRAYQSIAGWTRATIPGNVPKKLRGHAQFATDNLQKSRLEIDGLMTKHQLKLADRQCAMAELSERIQSLVVMLVTCLHASKVGDEVTVAAADVACQRLMLKYNGKRPGDRYYRAVSKLGKNIAEGQGNLLDGVDAPEIMMQYEQK